MYKRVLYEHWHVWLPLIAFGVASFVYLLMAFRGATLKKDQANHLAQLPFD